MNLCQPIPGEYHATAFGLGWKSNGALWLFAPEPQRAQKADVTVTISYSPPPPRQAVLQCADYTFCPEGLRFDAAGEAIIDIFGSHIVFVYPSHRWSGRLPLHVFSTVPAAIMAARGMVPLHGTAVEIAGQAVLICGPSRAGKSTFGARLIGLGARLISDDLSMLCSTDPASLMPGRPGMRLHPDTAGLLECMVPVSRSGGLHFGKYVVSPPCVEPSQPKKLGGIVLLSEKTAPLSPQHHLAVLCAQMFRPELISFLPGHAKRMAQLAKLVKTVPVLRIEGLRDYEPALCAARAQAIFAWACSLGETARQDGAPV